MWTSTNSLGNAIGQDEDILVARSADDGASWSAAAALNDNAASDADAVGGLSGASDREPSIASDGAGRWIVLWNSPTGIKSARSMDNGATWTAAVMVHAGNDYVPRLVTDRAGAWLALWQVNDGVQFDILAGTRMVHVPYTQSGQMNTDLMEGRVQVLFQSVSSVAELVRAGRMRALACSGAERLAAFPEVPTLREEGLDITTQGWFGLVTPAGVVEPILARLHAAAVESLRDPETAARIVQSGAIPRPQTREEFARFMAEQTEMLGALVRASGATLN